jgi:hypothetical protein
VALILCKWYSAFGCSAVCAQSCADKFVMCLLPTITTAVAGLLGGMDLSGIAEVRGGRLDIYKVHAVHYCYTHNTA